MGDDLNKKKTFLICGHAQAGKTLLCESILAETGAINRPGKIEDGTTVSDYQDDEKKRASSINLSVMHADYQQNNFNIIDTPGYPDFIGEFITALGAVDFAIVVVDATEGVAVGTEKALRYLAEHKIPVLFFINKLDKTEFNYQNTLKDIQKNLTKKAASVISYHDDKITFMLEDDKRDPKLYEKLTECVAESEDDLLEKYLEKGNLEESEVAGGLQKAITELKLFPVLGGSAVTGKGIDALLHFIVKEMPAITSTRLPQAVDSDGEPWELKPEKQGHLVAQVFKTIIDPFVGQLTILKVFSGEIKAHSEVYNANKGHKEKIGQLYKLQGKEQINVEALSAGDIGGITKLKDTATGDTLCDKKHMVKLSRVEFPSLLYSASLHPKTRQDEDKISSALARLTSEDLTCKVTRDNQTKELILSGMGELHLNTIVKRMRKKYGAEVDLGTPKVPYLETIAKAAAVSYRYKKQSGGRGQFGEVSIKVEPLERGKKFDFVNEIFGGAIPKNYIPSVEKGIKNAMDKGFVAGYPIVDIRIVLFDGSYHPVDSSDMAFQIAGSMALRKAFQESGGILLEPIMDVEITVEDEFTGPITGDLNAKRGRVMGMEPKSNKQVVKAQVPLAGMFKYASDLKSITGGRGSYAMHFSHYEPVPTRIAKGIIEKQEKS